MNVLIVDDDEIARTIDWNIIEHYIKKANVIFANNGMKAKQQFNENEIDLIICDMTMPRECNDCLFDGFCGLCFVEYVRSIKHNPIKRNVPIIVHSSLDTIEIKKKIASLGNSKYIMKPAFLEDFEEALEGLK